VEVFSDDKTKCNASTYISVTLLYTTQNVASTSFNLVHVARTGMSEHRKDLNRKPVSRVEFQGPILTFLG
jgi:hypothetical protein